MAITKFWLDVFGEMMAVGGRKLKFEFNIEKLKSMHFEEMNIRWQYHMLEGDGSRQLIDS